MKFQSNSIFNGTITANSVADAGTNTDKFLVLNSSGVVTYRTAAELYADLGVGASSAAYTSVLKHPVKAGEAINKGQAVYVSSANGTNMIVTKASNATEATSSKTIGLLETTLALNGIGNVITEGLLAGLDTTGATNAGDPVWLGTSGNLIYGLANKPYAPAHLVFIGIVTRINANNGEIFVKVQNGFELREIHDVDLITTTPINGHILGYDGTLWVNKTIASWLGFTPVTNARTLTINGTGYDLSADRSWTINSMVYPSAGIAVSTGTAWGTSITDNSTNWNTAYTNRITSLTVTGSSGAATLVSNTLNIPTYTLVGLGGVATSRTLTINGTAYDLSADRSWTIDSTSASTRTIQKFTATSGQTTFTITGGYAVGMVDVYMNGVKLDNATDFTASNGTTVVLAAGALTNSIVEVYKFGSQFIPNNALRVVTSFTATAAQTTFTVNYSVGLIDVFYNGSNLAQSEYTATNGTSIILATACQLNDIVVVYAYSYSVGAYSGIGGSGTSNYVSKFTASSVIGNSIIQDNGTNVSIGGTANTNSRLTLVDGTSIAAYWKATNTNTATRDWTIITNNANFGDFAIRQGNSQGADATVGTDRLLISAAGNVGIGTSSPTGKLMLFQGTAGNVLQNIVSNQGGSTQVGINLSPSMSEGEVAANPAQASIYATDSNYGANIIFSSKTTGAVGNALTERMRITSGGEIYMGTSTTDKNSRLVVYGSTSDGNTYAFRCFSSGSDILFGVRTDGYINTGNYTSSPYNLVRTGRVMMVDSGGGVGYQSSTRESKTNISNLEDISFVYKLNPVSFNYRKSEGTSNIFTDEYNEDLQYGLIADEVEKVNKDLVFYNDKDGRKELAGVEYGKLTSVLVKAIQEMNTKIIELEKLVATK